MYYKVYIKKSPWLYISPCYPKTPNHLIYSQTFRISINTNAFFERIRDKKNAHRIFRNKSKLGTLFCPFNTRRFCYKHLLQATHKHKYVDMRGCFFCLLVTPVSQFYLMSECAPKNIQQLVRAIRKICGLVRLHRIDSEKTGKSMQILLCTSQTDYLWC